MLFQLYQPQLHWETNLLAVQHPTEELCRCQLRWAKNRPKIHVRIGNHQATTTALECLLKILQVMMTALECVL